MHLNNHYIIMTFTNMNSTFDIIVNEDINTNSSASYITPLSAILDEQAPAVSFTLKLFKLKPYLFQTNAQSLMYAQYSGTAYKPDTIYNIFEMFMRLNDSKYISAKRMEPNIENTYKYDIDLLITWARVIQKTKTAIIFEPIMSNLSKMMNIWMNNRKVSFNGIEYDINIFKSLCYTYSGEPILSLLPYLCYIMTFLIHCRPYTFNEAQTESSTYGFYKSLNEYYQLNYTALSKDLGFNIVKSSNEQLAKLDDKYLIDLYKIMLHPDKIIQIRNREMSKTPELLDEAISDQNGLNMEFVKNAWNTTMTQLLKRIIQYSPIKKIFDSIPRFKPSGNLNVYELMMWTQYCLSGGDKPFCIDSEINTSMKGNVSHYSMMAHADPEAIQPLPSSVFTTQYIKSHIKSLTIAKGFPFCSNDVILELATAFLLKQFDTMRNDVLNDNPITIDESMLRDDNLYDKSLSFMLKDLFINGLWMKHNSSMSVALNLLLENKSFASEISDILSLSSVTQIVYDNRLASTIITTYILSYLDDWLLYHCNNNYNFYSFSPYSYLTTLEPSGNRIAKLLDMTISLLYISSKQYCSFVNASMKQFSDMMVMNPIIQQVYVKGLADAADIYAIGGCDLYNYAKISNPLIRGYGWVNSVYGTCEQLEIFYQWIKNLQNNSLMELFENSLSNISVIEMSLKLQYTKMFTNKSFPNLLSNYTFTPNGYKFRNYPYYLDLKTSDDKNIITIICEHTFPKSNASQSTEMSINFKPIIYSKGNVIAMKTAVNSMFVNESILPAKLSESGLHMKVPIYNFDGRVEEVKVIYVTPENHHAEIYTLFNSRYHENQTIILFTTMQKLTRFQNYDLQNNEFSNNNSVMNFTNEDDLQDFNSQTSPNTLISERVNPRR